MVFSSIPAYLDPANWQQQPNHTSNASNTHQQFAPPPPPPPPPHGIGASSIRPGSMADRARMANIPLPEAALKCPRCESTNTKFCYFNNYSLSQPRHFCKTCRRYWTRGGALRSVPVGGGCRRNKRSSKGGGGGSSSKSPSSTDHQTTASGNSTSSMSSASAASDHHHHHLLGLSGAPQFPPLRFMSPLQHHHLTNDFSGSGDIGLMSNYGSLTAPLAANNELNFHLGSAIASAGGGGGSFLSALSGLDQWRLQQAAQHHQQFPFLQGGLDSSTSSPSAAALLYPFEGGSGVEASGYGVRPKISTSGIVSQLAAASVKTEESHQQQQRQQQQELNLSRQFLGIHQGNEHHHQYWSSNTAAGVGVGGSAAAAWTDLSSFSSSSTSNNPS